MTPLGFALFVVVGFFWFHITGVLLQRPRLGVLLSFLLAVALTIFGTTIVPNMPDWAPVALWIIFVTGFLVVSSDPAFVVRRLIAGALTLFCIATICFLITRLSPGSPFSGERQLTETALENLNKYYGLNEPTHVQYATTMWNYLHGDLGPSYYHRGRDVTELVGPAMKNSVILGALAFLVALSIGVPLGILAAARQNKLTDHVTMSVSIAGICIPNFLLGPLLILLFSFVLGLLPVGRWPKDGSWAELQRLIMPVFTLSLVHIAYVSRLGRAGMLDVLNKDYIRTARAKGLKERTVVFKHGLKNGITPVLSYAGPMAALIITGSIVVEQIFALPGMGRFFVKSALDRDHPLLMGSILIFSTLIIFFNLIVDVFYSWLDPRVKVQ